jgi:hypothetical protein
MRVSLTPPCPACGTPAPFRKLLWGMGKPFACRSCAQELVIESNAWIPLLALVSWYRFRDDLDGFQQKAGLFLGLCVLVVLLSRIFMPAERVLPGRIGSKEPPRE